MRLNKPCEIEDFSDAAVVSLIRAMESDLVEIYPDHPHGREHRKSWEGQQVVRGLSVLGALERHHRLLYVGAGRDRALFELTNHVHLVVAADIYGDPERGQCDPFLLDPGRFARQPYHRRRLWPSNMDPRYLHWDDASFDGAVCKGLHEMSLLEVERVLAPDGYAALIIEFAADGGPAFQVEGSTVHSLESLNLVLNSAPTLRPVQDLQSNVSADTAAGAIDLREALDAAGRGESRFPHLVMTHDTRRFTTATIFVRKRA